MNPLFLLKMAQHLPYPVYRLQLAVGAPLLGTWVYLPDGVVIFLEGWEYAILRIPECSECCFLRMECIQRNTVAYADIHVSDAPDHFNCGLGYLQHGEERRERKEIRNDRLVETCRDFFQGATIPYLRETLSLLRQKLSLPPRRKE